MPQFGFLVYVKKNTINVIEDRRERQRAEGRYSEKAHTTGEFVTVVRSGDCALLCLASSLATEIRLAGRVVDQKLDLSYFF